MAQTLLAPLAHDEHYVVASSSYTPVYCLQKSFKFCRVELLYPTFILHLRIPGILFRSTSDKQECLVSLKAACSKLNRNKAKETHMCFLIFP